MNNAVYFRWLESSRVEYWERSGLNEAILPLGYGPILASVTCNYKRQIKFPDTVKIGSRVQKMGNSSVTLEHEVHSVGNEELCATGVSTIVLFDYQKQHPISISDDLRSIFDNFERSAGKKPS